MLILWEIADNGLKKHYIYSNKTAINKGKNTYKKHIHNQQTINKLYNRTRKDA